MNISKFKNYKCTSKKAYAACGGSTKIMICPPRVFNAAIEVF